ncbi:MAG: portal protein, partial [Candidatus Thorarchaeota archaeon]
MLEHEPRETEEMHKGGHATFSPSDKQRKTIKLVNKLFDRAKKHRAQFDDKWLEYYRMFRGRQWNTDRPSFRHSEVINMVFQNIQSMVPIMTDSRPKISFLPTEPADKDFAELLNDVLDADWETNNWLQELTQVIYDAHFYGTGVSRLEYDPDDNYGLGGIVYERADPFYCFPDPDATDVNKKSEFFIYAEPMCTEKLRKKYPKYKQYIKADLADFVDSDKGHGGPSQPKIQRILDRDLPGSDASEFKSQNQEQSLVITCFVKDKEIIEEEVKETAPDGSVKTVYQQRLAFPKGRKIVLISGVPVEDEEFPYEDGEFPYSRLVNYSDPGRFWGISEVEQLESPQKIFNKLVSFTLDVLTLMGNPVWIVDYDSGVDPENLVNRPGLVIEKEPGSEVRRQEGTQLQPYVMQMIDR